ncbi:hypothetical protein ACQ4PT_021089 [Festuca glaucescens]
MASSRRRRSTIAALSSGDRTATDLPGKVELATGYFMGLMGSAQPREADISLAAVGLGPIDLSALEAQFTESEVWDALRAMPANKSPGPDGFTWEFYRCCWPVVKGDVLAALRAIWMGRDQGFEALNEALITLLPKKDGAVDLKDFRPISLVHSFARLLTKVLARRLGPKMDLLVAPNQTAFIRGRCIQDNFLLVKESAKLLHRKQIPALLLKVDIAKTFDSISWSFLLSVLRQRGFGPRWLRWIGMLLRSVSTSVLVNGFAGDAFRHGRGLRQGDPISPLLFVIAMDVLSAMFAAVEGAGVISNLADVGLRHRVSLFADDVVSDHAVGLFNTYVIIKVGNGSSLLFWEDAWIDGLTVAAIATEVIKLVRPTARHRRTVQQGRVANSWALDISGQLSVDAVVQYLHLWTAVHRVLGAAPAASEEDSFRWKWSADGSFSSSGAYRVLFHGTVGLPAANLVWDSFAPLKYRMHAWLALHRRCWTADRRLRRGLPSHSLCPLCTATDETLDHLSLHCRYAQDLWAGLVARLRLPNIAPVAAVGINDWIQHDMTL